MKLSCSGREDVERFFQILQDYKFDKVKIELHSSSLDEDMKKSLLDKFQEKGLAFKQHSLKGSNDEDSDNLQDEDERLDVSMRPRDNAPIEDPVSMEIEDKYLAYFMKDREQKEYLAKFCINNNAQVDLEENKIRFAGPRKPVENIVAKIKALKYAISNTMPCTTAQTLKGTRSFKKLLPKEKEKKVNAKIFRHKDGENGNLVFFSNDQEVSANLAQEASKMVKNLLIVLELFTKSESPHVIQKITEYLQDFIQRKYHGTSIRYEFGNVNVKRAGKLIFYVYITDSQKKSVEQIKEFLENELASLCFLTINPNKKANFSLITTGISQHEHVNIVTFSDRSYLMIGKAKYMKKKVGELLVSDKAIESVYDYFLRFKRITYPNGEKVKTTQFINNTLAVTVQSDASLYGFKIFKSPEEIQKILEKLEIIVRNKKQSTGSGTIKMEETKTEEKNEVLFPKENQTETFFDIGDIQPGDGLSLEEETDEFKKLAKLLQKDYPQANIKEITKCHLEDQWKMYLNYRKEGPKEYIGFIDSQDPPTDIMENYKAYPERTIRSSFNPSTHSCPQSEDEFVLCACTVLVAANDPKQIIGYYPAYFISFK